MTTPTKSLEEYSIECAENIALFASDKIGMAVCIRAMLEHSTTQARAEEMERFKAQEELLEECEKLLSRDIVFQAERMALLTKLQERNSK